jgi:hypothetical protein
VKKYAPSETHFVNALREVLDLAPIDSGLRPKRAGHRPPRQASGTGSRAPKIASYPAR